MDTLNRKKNALRYWRFFHLPDSKHKSVRSGKKNLIYCLLKAQRTGASSFSVRSKEKTVFLNVIRCCLESMWKIFTFAFSVYSIIIITLKQIKNKAKHNPLYTLSPTYKARAISKSMKYFTAVKPTFILEYWTNTCLIKQPCYSKHLLLVVIFNGI